jgi:hypothetical protein
MWGRDDDTDDDNPPVQRLNPDESPLEDMDPGLLREVGFWWQDEIPEIAADAVETVSAETECTYDEAIAALADEFGERDDLEDVVGILNERSEEAATGGYADDDDDDEEAEGDEDEDDSDDSDDEDAEDAEDEDEGEDEDDEDPDEDEDDD